LTLVAAPQYKFRRVSTACFKWISLTLACQVGWFGCIRKPPPPPRAPPRAPEPVIRVPAGCLEDLSGAYVHSQNPNYNYQATDDGGTLLIAVERGRSDAGVPRTESNPISVSLVRTPKGFVGETQAMLFVATGRACPVDFPTEIIACDDAGLMIKSAVSSAVDESCQPSQAPGHAVMAEHRLIRALPTPAASPSPPPSPSPSPPQSSPDAGMESPLESHE
jgi:hypothetical protein